MERQRQGGPGAEAGESPARGKDGVYGRDP